MRSSFCRRRESLCTAVATSSCFNEALFTAKLERSLLLQFRRILLCARRHRQTIDPHCTRKHPKKPCATQHSSITPLAGLGDYAMRRKLCCLAALFVLILCNEVRLIIVDRAIKLRCWFTRLSTPGCDMQGASAQTTASALLFTSVSTTAGNTSVEYTSCSLEKSFAVTGEPLNQTALKTTSGARRCTQKSS